MEIYDTREHLVATHNGSDKYKLNINQTGNYTLKVYDTQTQKEQGKEPAKEITKYFSKCSFCGLYLLLEYNITSR